MAMICDGDDERDRDSCDPREELVFGAEWPEPAWVLQGMVPVIVVIANAGDADHAETR